MLFVFGYRAQKIRSKKLSVLIHSSDKHKDVESCTVEVHFQKIIDKVYICVYISVFVTQTPNTLTLSYTKLINVWFVLRRGGNEQFYSGQTFSCILSISFPSLHMRWYCCAVITLKTKHRLKSVMIFTTNAHTWNCWFILCSNWFLCFLIISKGDI